MSDPNRLATAGDFVTDFHRLRKNGELFSVNGDLGFVWINLKEKDMEPGTIDKLREMRYICTYDHRFGWEIRKTVSTLILQ